jgi:hypothetical protein
MQVEVAVVVKALQFRCNKILEILSSSHKEYLQASETRGLFCSFEACGQYVKKNGRIILEAYLAI